MRKFHKHREQECSSQAHLGNRTARKTAKSIATSALWRTEGWQRVGQPNGRFYTWAYRKSLTVFDQDQAQYTTMSLFPNDHPIPAGVSNDSSAGGGIGIETAQCIWELLVGM
jgi:hypothetical protein